MLPNSVSWLEEIAKWEHEDQRRFADRLVVLAANLPKQFEPDDYFRGKFSPFELVLLPADPSALRCAARCAFNATLAEING